jgi:hypothetical protein
LVSEVPELVTVELLLQRREDFLFLFLDMMLDAGSEHGDGGTESGLVDQLLQLGESVSDEAVFDAGFFGVFSVDEFSDEWINVGLLDLHVQIECGDQFLDGSPPTGAGITRSQSLEHGLNLAVILLQEDDWIIHGALLAR